MNVVLFIIGIIGTVFSPANENSKIIALPILVGAAIIATTLESIKK